MIALSYLACAKYAEVTVSLGFFQWWSSLNKLQKDFHFLLVFFSLYIANLLQ